MGCHKERVLINREERPSAVNKTMRRRFYDNATIMCKGFRLNFGALVYKKTSQEYYRAYSSVANAGDVNAVILRHGSRAWIWWRNTALKLQIMGLIIGSIF